LRIIFHSTYENGQFDRKTAFYTRNFQLFGQEEETGNGFFRPGIRGTAWYLNYPWDSRLIKGRHNGGLIYFGSSYKHCQYDLADR
jgi:hypothetical protein